MNKIAIIGAGISGLSMANYLEKYNIDYHIYERRKKDDLAGHGFLLPQEGIEYLSHIVDENTLFKEGNFLKKYIHYSHTGRVISERKLENVFVISRRSLINILSHNIPSDKISYEKTITFCDTKKGKLKYPDGSYINSDIVVVSDGSKSRIRKEIFKNEVMNSVRDNEVVNIIENKEIADRIENNFMKFHHEDGGLTFGILKLSDAKVLWYSQFDSLKYQINEDCSVENLKRYTQKIFADWHPLVSSIVNGSSYENIHLWRVYELEKLNKFHQDNIVFIGDAAHPLIPFTSQGVTSALKDAFILTKLLLEEKNPEEVFRKYEEERKPEIEFHIKNGRTLLEQFLLPLDQQKENILPISYK
ncbi:2-polyprenyl-6-methoxyphenol hydroxylase-like FAD-dependent oxidoreductase [Chryseobacterium sp. H1D6B]|uniref:FAD-dependent monooxygenase n=1 Tax=Chryseobacterium sp. H1D6B TaxID=2940588 RepID=UPI0015CBB608|nr:FAD-dependent monooxygenase [Chryseobacterium sp. H1D6B]MDH6251483.1 2-polyprenyl-6-methoxyphenol hydroxylase-like FAD-dependent oxidoreductase [Chryseobacterium sp. H1D6B]